MTAHELSVLETSIQIKKDQLRSLTALRGKQEQEFLDKLSAFNRKIDTYSEKVTDYKEELRELRKQRGSLEKDIALENARVTAFETEKSNRKAYLDDLEQTIADTTEEGNIRLKSLSYEIDDLIEVKKTVQVELHDLNKDKSRLMDDIAALSKVADDMQRAQDFQIVQNNVTQDKFDKRILAAQQTLDATNQEVESKLAKLKVREREIIVKLEVIKNERVKLDTDKRRWNNTKNLYGDVE